MIKFIKKCVFFVIITLLILIFVILGILTYIDSHSTEAKNFLLNNYEINKKDWYAIKYTEYIYEDIADCNSLWLKKCTDNETLQYSYTFINKKKEQIIVYEDKLGNFTISYDGETPLTEKEKNKEEINIENINDNKN